MNSGEATVTFLGDVARPTMRLRFVERDVAIQDRRTGDYTGSRPFRILQQEWVTDAGDTEWRDVPLESEVPE